MKSLFGKACPSFTFGDEVNCGRVYPGNDGKRVAWYASTKCAPNVNDLALGQLMGRRILTSKIDEASAPLMFGVFRQGDPFKVIRPIVKFVPIDVINRKSISVTINERHSDKSVNKNFWSFVCKFGGHNVITSLGDPRLYLLLLTIAIERLQLAIFHSFGKSHDGGAKDARIFTDKPINSFFMNNHCFHVVYCSAGQ